MAIDKKTLNKSSPSSGHCNLHPTGDDGTGRGDACAAGHRLACNIVFPFISNLLRKTALLIKYKTPYSFNDDK